MIEGTAFYTVSSRAYFLGAVAMINSLRLHGHDEPVFVLDCGLTREQREWLAATATVVAGPDAVAPHMLKPIAPRLHPARTMVLMDADLIVTRPLGELIELAGDGRVVAFRNNEERWEDAWGELLDLGPLEPIEYMFSSWVALGGELGAEVMELFGDRVGWVDVARTSFSVNLLDPAHRPPEYPLHLMDQDVLNAVVAATARPQQIVALATRGTAMIPFDGLEVVDAARLRCRYDDGTEPYLLHHILPGKPWLEAAAESAYSILLRRLLNDPELAIAIPPAALPRRLREGPLGRLDRACARALLRARWNAGVGRARLGNAARRIGLR